jgi:protein TonB
VTVVRLPRRPPPPPPAPPLAADRVLPFVNPRVPKVVTVADAGPTPRVCAPRKAEPPPPPRRRERYWTGALSALVHLTLVGLALGQTTGALSSGDGGVLEVTLVAALPPSAAAPAVPDSAPARPEEPVAETAAPAAPAPDARLTPPRAAAQVTPPAAEVPLPAVPPEPKAEVAAMTAPPAPDGTAPPPPAGLAAPQPRAEPTPPPRVAEPAAPPPKPHPKPAVAHPAQAGGKARGAGAGAAAGAGGAAALTTGPGVDRSALAGWGAQIMAGVERHKRFPVAAGDTRGTVGVALTVTRDGALAAARVVTPSGIAALDLAAVQAVRAAAPFPAAPDTLGGASYSFTLTVKFGG